MSRNKKEIAYKEETVRHTDSILENFSGFTDGIRVLFLIHRNKEGGETNNTKVKKIITKNSKEFREALLGLVEMKERSDTPLRIYSALNPRNIEKAIRQFKFEMLEADYFDKESRNGFYYDTQNRFIGCLMAPSSRSESLFLIDVDTPEANAQTLTELSRLNIEIVKVYPTKNGSHIITAPFNPALLQVPDAEVKKDGLLLLAF